MRTFTIPSAEADAHLERIAARSRSLSDGEAARVAQRAVSEIRAGKDAALERWRRRFDGVSGGLRASRIPGSVTPGFRRALDVAIERISRFHALQKTPAARLSIAGSLIEERVVPLDSAGVYIPGGEAVYVSTALMTILPARLAGVKRIAVATPPAAWDRSPELRHALSRLGIREVYRMGGAHAIAALALGTESIPSVAKVVGPGNRFVAAAKRAVSGIVGIDGIAGPTEVVIFADGSADAGHIAADLLAQAEHAADAAALLVTTSAALGRRVDAAVARQIAALPQSARGRAASSLRRYGAIGLARSRSAAVSFLEELAPEHLGIQTSRSNQDARLFQRAGAVFAGAASSEVFGDYAAGSNHVLPTNGTARFASGLSVRDFVRRFVIVSLSARDARSLAPSVEILAQAEGLPAHAAAARLRRTVRP